MWTLWKDNRRDKASFRAQEFFTIRMRKRGDFFLSRRTPHGCEWDKWRTWLISEIVFCRMPNRMPYSFCLYIGMEMQNFRTHFEGWSKTIGLLRQCCYWFPIGGSRGRDILTRGRCWERKDGNFTEDVSSYISR